MSGERAGDDGARVRFVREIAAAKRVAPFSTARVLDADVAGNQPYVVTEYVDGPSLHRLVTEEGPRSGGLWNGSPWGPRPKTAAFVAARPPGGGLDQSIYALRASP